MTRRKMLKLAASRKHPCWYTPQGQYVLQLRNELEKLGYFDDLKEDWEIVEEALKRGWAYFTVEASRATEKKLYYRIVPSCFAETAFNGIKHLEINSLSLVNHLNFPIRRN